MNWKHRVKIKHLMTDAEDYESVQQEMTAIADTLKASLVFESFNYQKFYKIPKGDNDFRPIDYANKYLNQMYDYADYHAIWIE